MLATIRYDKGLGSTAFYARARDVQGRYFDWTAQTWGAVETEACKKYLVESQDTATDSRYSATLTFEATPDSVIEYVRVSTSEVVIDEPATSQMLGQVLELLNAPPSAPTGGGAAPA